MSKARIYEEIFRNYERIRDENKRITDERRKGVYLRFPRVEEIDREINLLGFQISKAVLNADTQEEKEKYISQIKNRNLELVGEKKKILVKAGLGEDYLEPVYSCRRCKDTGRIGNERCDCLTKAYRDAIYEKSNIKDILDKENFKSFDLDFYSKQEDRDEGISPYENMKRNLVLCKGFCKNFDKEFKNLIFYGKPGLGKTFLCSAIAKELLERGKNVVYVSAFDLFKVLEDEKFGRSENIDNSEFYEQITHAELLIIDDLGTEFSTIVSTSALFSIINVRFINSRPTIISTNLSLAEIAGQYSERIVSRIYGEYTVLKFFGDDIRILKRLR